MTTGGIRQDSSALAFRDVGRQYSLAVKVEPADGAIECYWFFEGSGYWESEPNHRYDYKPPPVITTQNRRGFTAELPTITLINSLTLRSGDLPGTRRAPAALWVEGHGFECSNSRLPSSLVNPAVAITRTARKARSAGRGLDPGRWINVSPGEAANPLRWVFRKPTLTCAAHNH